MFGSCFRTLAVIKSVYISHGTIQLTSCLLCLLVRFINLFKKHIMYILVFDCSEYTVSTVIVPEYFILVSDCHTAGLEAIKKIKQNQRPYNYG